MRKQIKDEAQDQDEKLRAALEARRKKRAQLIENVGNEKHNVIQ